MYTRLERARYQCKRSQNAESPYNTKRCMHANTEKSKSGARPPDACSRMHVVAHAGLALFHARDALTDITHPQAMQLSRTYSVSISHSGNLAHACDAADGLLLVCMSQPRLCLVHATRDHLLDLLDLEYSVRQFPSARRPRSCVGPSQPDSSEEGS